MSPPVVSTLRRTSLQPLGYGVYVVTAISPVVSVSFTFNVAHQGKLSQPLHATICLFINS